MTYTIRKDLHLSQTDIANSNILSLVATLLVRLTAGSACDRFGARWTFATILLLGAVPTALAGTVTTPAGLIALRLFVGILGGSFIPCQVWTTGFFDKSVVGTANALTAGLGNAGSGVTYFLMPAIFESLINRQHLSDHVAWRVTFVVPFLLIIATAVMMIVTCPDTPTGSWSSRARDVQRHMDMRDTFVSTKADRKKSNALSIDSQNDTVKLNSRRDQSQCSEAQTPEDDLLTAASWELVEKPTARNSAKAVSQLPTVTLAVAYFCTFGIELCINSILGAFYDHQFSSLGQTDSGKYAAIFGVLNAVFRPAGGILSDAIYRFTDSLWSKKVLMHVLNIFAGIFMVVIGLETLNSKAQMVGLMTGLAFFVESANGSCFSLVPHVQPTSNGRLFTFDRCRASEV